MDRGRKHWAQNPRVCSAVGSNATKPIHTKKRGRSRGRLARIEVPVFEEHREDARFPAESIFPLDNLFADVILMAMKFEIFLLHRDEIYVKYVDVPSVIGFLGRIRNGVMAYSVIARRGKKAIFIEKITNLTDLNKELTEFMVATANQQ